MNVIEVEVKRWTERVKDAICGGDGVGHCIRSPQSGGGEDGRVLGAQNFLFRDEAAAAQGGRLG